MKQGWRQRINVGGRVWGQSTAAVQSEHWEGLVLGVWDRGQAEIKEPGWVVLRTVSISIRVRPRVRPP